MSKVSAALLERSAPAAEGLAIHGLGDMPGHLIRRLHQIGVAHFVNVTQECCDLTPVQYATLVAADSRPGIDQRSLAGMIAFDRSTIGDVIQRLEQRGLLRRENSRSDRRAKHVFLSDEGRALLQRVDPLVVRSQQQFLSPLSDGEQAILMFLLRKLADLSNDMSPAPLRIVDASENENVADVKETSTSD
jgi:MarR family transcriptional regulator, temperature-dependent positive regulator of motility